ncbi:MAG: proline--tRNA ligase [Treponemataceae bacterium]
MKRSKIFIPTLRENPNDAVIRSHQLILRAGLVRRIGNGLFAYLPLGLRIFNKVSNIIREELNKIDSQEFKPSVMVPGELWQESNRWNTMGAELLRVKNRLEQDLVFSPTAEELFTGLLRHELSSYKNYPLTAYQINTKYRDEIRPRYGLMRTREFTMMDAYSFHTCDKSLDKVYDDFEKAYIEIFRRCGLSTIIVKADSGAMGGAGSQEFMVESEIGDDTLVLCSNCRYAANLEKAESLDSPEIKDLQPSKTDEAITEVATPNVKTIEELEKFFSISQTSFIKTLIYEAESSEFDELNEAFAKNKNKLFAVCIRGDLEVNEAKLKANLKLSDLVLADDALIEEKTNAKVGFIGPIGLENLPIVVDNSVLEMHDAFCGGLKKDVHLKHIEPSRDIKADFIFDFRTAKENELCINCSTPLYTKKGTEVGHIFKLGKKYTESMNFTYLDENGKLQKPTMGCYGIGVDRTLAAIIEEHNDEKGIVWPMSVTPFHATVLAITKNAALNAEAENFYNELEKAGLEVLFDDRDERAGVKLADSELIGIPVRIIFSDKNKGKLEVGLRATGETKLMPPEKAKDFVVEFVKSELERLG